MNIYKYLLIMIFIQSNFRSVLNTFYTTTLLPWEDWSSCSRTCGGGVQNRTRDYCLISDTGVVIGCIENYDSQTRSCSTDCFNGGIFFNYSCQCAEGYSGICCSMDVDECDGSPCRNYMPCVNTNGSFYCNSNNYGGRFCEIQNKRESYCTTSESSMTYCASGCCGHGNCQYCCKNEIAIGYITAAVAAATLLFIGAVVILCIKTKHRRNYRKIETNTISIQTEISIPPTIKWNTSSDPRRGRRYAANGRFSTPPPQGVLNRIIQIRQSRAEPSKESKQLGDPESGRLETKQVHDAVKRLPIKLSNVKRKPSPNSKVGNILTIEEID